MSRAGQPSRRSYYVSASSCYIPPCIPPCTKHLHFPYPHHAAISAGERELYHSLYSCCILCCSGAWPDRLSHDCRKPCRRRFIPFLVRPICHALFCTMVQFHCRRIVFLLDALWTVLFLPACVLWFTRGSLDLLANIFGSIFWGFAAAFVWVPFSDAMSYLMSETHVAGLWNWVGSQHKSKEEL